MQSSFVPVGTDIGMGTDVLCHSFIEHGSERLGPFQRQRPLLFSAAQDLAHQPCLEHKFSDHLWLYNLENVLHSVPTKPEGFPDARILAGEGAV